MSAPGLIFFSYSSLLFLFCFFLFLPLSFSLLDFFFRGQAKVQKGPVTCLPRLLLPALAGLVHGALGHIHDHGCAHAGEPVAWAVRGRQIVSSAADGTASPVQDTPGMPKLGLNDAESIKQTCLELLADGRELGGCTVARGSESNAVSNVGAVLAHRRLQEFIADTSQDAESRDWIWEHYGSLADAWVKGTV